LNPDDRAGLAEPDSAAEDLEAARRRSAIEAGRRKGGVAGAALAGAMIAVSDIVEGPRRDDAPVTVEAAGEPHDIDRDGVSLEVDGVAVVAPPLRRPGTPRDGAASGGASGEG
jgi:hypothetical protein